MSEAANSLRVRLFSMVEFYLNRNEELASLIPGDRLDPVKEIFFPVATSPTAYPSILLHETQISMDRHKGITFFEPIPAWRWAAKSLVHPRTRINHRKERKNVPDLEVLHYMHRLSDIYPHSITVAYWPDVEGIPEREDIRYGTFDLRRLRLFISELRPLVSQSNKPLLVT